MIKSNFGNLTLNKSDIVLAILLSWYLVNLVIDQWLKHALCVSSEVKHRTNVDPG